MPEWHQLVKPLFRQGCLQLVLGVWLSVPASISLLRHMPIKCIFCLLPARRAVQTVVLSHCKGRAAVAGGGAGAKKEKDLTEAMTQVGRFFMRPRAPSTLQRRPWRHGVQGAGFRAGMQRQSCGHDSVAMWHGARALHALLPISG